VLHLPTMMTGVTDIITTSIFTVMATMPITAAAMFNRRRDIIRRHSLITHRRHRVLTIMVMLSKCRGGSIGIGMVGGDQPDFY